MIYFDLFIGFLKVGLFAFGGAYGAIPLIRDVVLSYDWIEDEMLTYMIAVSESTLPGCPYCYNSSCASFVYYYPAHHGPIEKTAEEPICASCSERIETVHHRHHSGNRYLYDSAA